MEHITSSTVDRPEEAVIFSILETYQELHFVSCQTMKFSHTPHSLRDCLYKGYMI